jgi:hypothetical protein
MNRRVRVTRRAIRPIYRWAARARGAAPPDFAKEVAVEEGRAFLRAQVNNAIGQHQSLVEALEDHVRQAEDRRFRDLCQRYLPQVQLHQRRLQEYGSRIGAEGRTGVKGALGAILGKARDLADAVREGDFLRIVGDIVMIRQAQDTFGLFGAIGDRIGEPQLAELGKECERDHEQMQRDFNALARNVFVDQVQGIEIDTRDSVRTTPDVRPL